MPPKHLATIKDLAFSVPEEVSEASSFLHFVAIPSENGGHEEYPPRNTLRGNLTISADGQVFACGRFVAEEENHATTRCYEFFSHR